MNALRAVGLFAIIPATLLLTISFFVLFTIRKIETQGLKVFGYVIAMLLWVSVLLVVSSGVYTLATGRHPLFSVMREIMRPPMRSTISNQMPMMQYYRDMMMRNKMPPAVPEQKNETMMKH